MQRIDTIVIGAGQAGLSMSRCLTDRGREHVVLERGRIGERWRTERWDSLRLLTPNWLNRLPGQEHPAENPDGFESVSGFVRSLDTYAQTFGAPVEQETTVLRAAPAGDEWVVRTDRGDWRANQVVIATGAMDRPYVPSISQGLSLDLHQVTTNRYRNPEQLPSGGVLVVGASASGAQLADEIRASGRKVAIAVGQHTRLPRTYRGRDIMWWLDRMGVLDRALDDMPDPVAARREPSLQLVGRPTLENIDVDVLRSRGVTVAGRLVSADEHRVGFSDDLTAMTAEADAKMSRVLDRIDRFADSNGLLVPEADRPSPIASDPGPATLDLRAEGIETVLWATGYRRVYPWLHASVLDRHGEIEQRRGMTPAPGLYILGLQFMTRRSSSFIGGVGRDAEEIAARIAPKPRDEWRMAA